MGTKSRKKKRSRKGRRPDLTSPSAIQQSIAAGRAAFAAGNWREVISTWQPLVDTGVTLDQDVQQEIHTKLAHAHFAHGVRFYAQDNPAAVLSEMHMATRLHPDELRYKYHLGLAYHRNGNLQQAIELYREVLAKDAGHRRASHQLQLACLEAGETEAAIALEVDEAVRWVVAGDYRDALETLVDDGPVQMTLTFGGRGLQEEAGEAHGADAEDPVRMGQRGLLLLAVGDSVRAARLIEKALAGLPGTTFAAYLRYAQGILSARSGEFAQAITAFEAAVEGGVDMPAIRDMVWKAYHHRARQQAAAGHLRQAAALWGKAAECRRNDKVAVENQVRAYLHLGCEHWKDDAFDKAEREWQRALAIEPEHPEVLHNMALAAERLEKWEQANQYWEQLLRSWRPQSKRHEPIWSERHVWVHRRRIRNWYRLGDAYEVEQDYKAALTWKSDDVDLLLEVADFYGQLEEWSSAERHFRRVLAIEPTDAVATSGLAEVLQAQGKAKKAAKVWEELMAKEPKSPRALAEWRSALMEEGRQHVVDGDFAYAMNLFEKILARDPNFVPALVFGGHVELIRSGLHDAIPWFERATQVEQSEDEVWKAYVDIGAGLYYQGYEKEAKSYFDRAEALSDHPYLFLGLAEVFAHDGRKRLTSRYCQRAVDVCDNDLEVIIAAGMCCVIAGNKRASQNFSRQARRLDPFDPRVYELEEMIADEFGGR